MSNTICMCALAAIAILAIIMTCWVGYQTVKMDRLLNEYSKESEKFNIMIDLWKEEIKRLQSPGKDAYDVIKNPQHYCFGSIQPKDAIRDWGLNFNLGNVVKYVVRAGRKGNALEDLRKARTYLDFEIEALEAEDRANDT